MDYSKRSLRQSPIKRQAWVGILAGLVVASQALGAPSPVSSAQPNPGGFEGAEPQPVGKTKGPVSQLKIRFPKEMVKEANKEAFKVACSPAAPGFSGWADNNQVWTYDFKAASEKDSPRLSGGTKCSVTQTADLKAADGTVWKNGTIGYEVVVTGPNVTSITPAHGFGGNLREADPVVLITFDGPVDRAKFFVENNGYLAYTSSNAPSEKIPLVPVPADQGEKLFKHFKSSGYFDVEYQDRNWLLATAKQNLIPGADVSLTIQSQTSADNADVKSEEKYAKTLHVRGQFEAKIVCANPSAKSGSCMPASPIQVEMNGLVKWADIKDSYIEYIPFKSTDKKPVRTFAQIPDERKLSYWESLLTNLSYYFPFLAKYSDTVLDQIVFNVDIEPQTQAKVVLPSGLKDLDNRVLSNVITEFHIRIGAMDEEIRMPHDITFLEKQVKDVYLPVGIVNLHQKISIRKSGTDPKVWSPVKDPKAMIQLIRAYQVRGPFRDQKTYVSPLEQTSTPSSVVEETLNGQKNRLNVLQFPLKTKETGLYAIEISSASFESKHSDTSENRFYNPKYSLAQVTDLTIHMKRGKKSNLAWVTRLSDGAPVAQAQVEVYNCLGEKVASAVANAQGLASFPEKTWASDCKKPNDQVYSEYFEPGEFYAVAKTADDQALIHTSWSSEYGYAMGAPGIDYFYSDVVDNEPHYHAVIGVNLVKPGQQVPIELIAKLPLLNGFAEVPAADLPSAARIQSADDNDIFYDFPLSWKNGKAEITWNVPADASVRLGRYTIALAGQGDKEASVAAGDIEVAEFKIPLMSGIIALPNTELVRPDSILVGSTIRYANGVGAKKLGADLSYYFSPTTISSEELPGFTFGSGPMTKDDQGEANENRALPTASRPAVIQGLKTTDDGQIQRDVAKEPSADGRTVAEVLKSVDRPQHLVVRVRYQDQIGEYQTLSQSKDIYNSASYVGTKLVTGSRTDARLQIAVVDVKKKNITSLGDLGWKLIRVETKVIGEEVFGGLIKNTIERELKPVRWTPNCALVDQVASCPIGALKEGSYAFEASSKASGQFAHVIFKVDSEGRVYGQDEYSRFGDDEGSKQLPLVLNKPEYKNGERAVVSFAAPFKTCHALVTLERSDVIESFVASDACAKGRVEVPVRAELAPNAFVSVFAITGRATAGTTKPGDVDLGRPTYRLGFANVKVDWAKYKTAVTVATNKPKYEPGETVEVAVQVRPEEGQLQGGSVTLVALEEKILELKPNDTYKILDALMQLRRHSVTTVTALERIDTIVGGNEDMPDPSRSGRKGGDEGGDGSSKSDFKRKLFNALVAFQANVPVQNGVAKFSFKTNDSLTRFKVFAVATDQAQKFGMGEAVYLTEKDTQAYSNIPSIARSGDKYPLKVTVQNNTGKDAKYRAEITAVVKDKDGKVLATKKLEKQTSIGKSASEAIDVGQFEIADEAAQIEYTVRVYDENGKLVDDMQPEAQKVFASTPLAIHDSFLNQTENGALTKTIVKDKDALANQGEIRVWASNSLVATALTQIGQRASAFTFGDFFLESRFQMALLRSSEAKPEKIKKELESLIGYLDAEGFVKYFPQARRGSVHLTASLLHSLQLEPWTAKYIPTALREKLKGAVSSVLTKSVNSDYIGSKPMDWMRAQVAMARAAFLFGEPLMIDAAKAINSTINAEIARNPKAYGEEMEKWSHDDVVDRWLLEVYAAPNDAKASAAQKILVKRLVYSGNQAQLNGMPTYGIWYSDETIETSKMLLGHSLLKGDAKLAKNLAAGLAGANIKGWYNLSTMAYVAEGLKSFGRVYEAEKVTGVTLVSIPEEQKSTSIDFSSVKSGSLVSPWLAQKATVDVKHGGQGQPWVSVQALSAVPLTQARGQGLAIEKEVRNITRESGYQAGDILEVTLKINANSLLRHVAVFDPIPSGANILAEAYGAFSSGQKSYAGYNLYFEALPGGISSVKYQYQLNNPGVFKLPPTRAEGLYMPSLFAEAPNAVMTIQ